MLLDMPVEGSLGKRCHKTVCFNYVMVIRGVFPEKEPITDDEFHFIEGVFRNSNRHWNCYRPFVSLSKFSNENNESENIENKENKLDGRGEAKESESKFVEIVMDVGNVLEDEWYAMYLVHFISRQYPRSAWHFDDPKGCILSTYCSRYFPNWLRDEKDKENRVFMQRGIVCYFEKAKGKYVDYRKVANRRLSFASPKLNEVFSKLLLDVKRHEQRFHKARVCVPRGTLRYLNLYQNRSLCIKAVHCDASLKVYSAKEFKRIKLEDFVETTFEFTREQYLNLIQHEIFSPKERPESAEMKELLGYALTVGLETILEIAGYKIDETEDDSVCEEDEDNSSWADMELIRLKLDVLEKRMQDIQLAASGKDDMQDPEALAKYFYTIQHLEGL